MKKIGIALGGGGAKGLAHLLILETLEELGVKPACIAGTSIGAIVGSMYASGRSAKDLRSEVEALILEEAGLIGKILGGGSFKWLKLLGIDWDKGGLVNTDDFLEELGDSLGVQTFEELAIPLKVVAASFWGMEEVVLDRGEILPAVRASMALPGIFRPVLREGRVLVDGGAVNPVPFDVLDADCDITIAVDVLGERKPADESGLPNLGEAIFQTYSVMETSIAREKRKRKPVTIYLRPEIEGVRVLEFHKTEQILEQSKSAAEQLKRELTPLLEG